MKPKIGVVTLNYFSHLETKSLIESLILQKDVSVQLVIVDNSGSEKEFSAMLGIIKTIFGKENLDGMYTLPDADFMLKYHKSDVNTGFSGGLNLGVSFLSNDCSSLLLVNNDIVLLSETMLKEMHIFLSENVKAAVLGPCILNKDGTLDSPLRKDEGLWSVAKNFAFRVIVGNGSLDIRAAFSKSPVSVFKISGAFMFWNRKVFNRVSGLDENVWLGSEEAIISTKIKRLGMKIYYLPNLHCIHTKMASPRVSKENLRTIYIQHYKNRKYYYKTYRKSAILERLIFNLRWRLKIRKLKSN